jgi:HD-GYP domain-containing protein (c-di-GMP phosphodiesterase class II)
MRAGAGSACLQNLLPLYSPFAWSAPPLPRIAHLSMPRTRKPSLERSPRARGATLSASKATHELEELNRIGIALSETRDVGLLLDLILTKAREITGADAGSLYLVERDADPTNRGLRPPQLRFKLTQNDSVQFPFSEHTLPLTEESIAGYCALHGEVIELSDAYRIPKLQPFHFNSSFDQEAGYRTRSLIALPMKNGKGEVLGVLQLINCKRIPKLRLTDAASVRRLVHPFPERAVRLGLSLASQAAVAYENSRLYRDIENLFDGFVSAAVKAIEQRDPTTSGHSQRVCEMTVALAEAVDREPRGPYGDLRFSREQMKELRYAALLHDFGKVGVREEVLIKAKKLYPMQFVRVLDRFDYIRRDIEARISQQKVEALLSLSRKEAEKRLRALDEEARRLLGELDRFAEFIARANEPTLLPTADSELLGEIARKTYRDPRGTERPYLSSEELRFLSIPRGTLDPDERRQIESHVVHSFNFLAQIPWTPEFRGIPTIARAHHEKINGKGYPFGLNSDQIPIQAKMMTICDIYDALSASDRPYKRAIPTDRALDILKICVREEEIDPELFRVFLDAHIYRLAGKS